MGIIFERSLHRAKIRTFNSLRQSGLTIKEAKQYKVTTSKAPIEHIKGWKTYEVKKVGDL